MGIITLGIGPPEPNMTYLLTGGLNIGTELVVVPIPVYTATSEIRLVATSAAAVRLTATAESELEP